MEHEFEEFYRVDAGDDWINGAYDESGDQVICDACGDDLKFDPESRTWRCVFCGNEKGRVAYFGYIGATPPGGKCFTCMENYPFCTGTCPWYEPADDNPFS